MRYEVSHATSYAYATPVDLGTHVMHLQPRSLPWQRVESSALYPDPQPGRLFRRRDCFGNEVTWMFIDTPHPRFAVTMRATVEVTAPAWPDADTTPAWEQVSRIAFGHAGNGTGAQTACAQAGEFLFDSPMITGVPEARDYAAVSFPPDRPVMRGLLDLNRRIGEDFTFKGGVTTVGTPIRQVLAQRSGVCQDFSHLMIAGLRGLGLPARYVSGYIRTRPPPGQPRLKGADQSHAWVACWAGPEHGWIDIDPTNGILIGDNHVVLGWGRDYGDVSPICGVILGGGKHTVTVAVDLEALE